MCRGRLSGGGGGARECGRSGDEYGEDVTPIEIDVRICEICRVVASRLYEEAVLGRDVSFLVEWLA